MSKVYIFETAKKNDWKRLLPTFAYATLAIIAATFLAKSFLYDSERSIATAAIPVFIAAFFSVARVKYINRVILDTEKKTATIHYYSFYETHAFESYPWAKVNIRFTRNWSVFPKRRNSIIVFKTTWDYYEISVSKDRFAAEQMDEMIRVLTALTKPR